MIFRMARTSSCVRGMEGLSWWKAARRRLFYPHTGGLRDFRPLGKLRLAESVEPFGRATHGGETGRNDALLHVGHLQDFDELAIERCNDGFRCARGDVQPAPWVHF